MAITAYTGLPRHGKSYGAVENVIAPALQKGRKVFTNIPMHNDICLARFNNQVTQFDIQDLIDNPEWFTEVFIKGAILVLDEIWELWPSGLKANNALVQHKTFLAKHGHMVGEDGYSTSVVFVTQDLGQIAAFARQLVETTFIVEKLIAVGQEKKYRVDVFSGGVTGLKPPVSKRTREIFGIRKDEIHQLYVSQTDSDSVNELGIEESIDNRFNILKGGSLKYLLFGLVGFILFGGFLANKFYHESHYLNDSDSNAVESELDDSSKNKKNLLQSLKQIQFDKKAAIKEKKEIELDKINDVLSKSDSIYVIGSIVSPDEDKSIYQYKVVYDDSSVLLSKLELTNLGYTVTIINNCLTTIKGYDHAHYAMCKDSSISSNGLISMPKA